MRCDDTRTQHDVTRRPRRTRPRRPLATAATITMKVANSAASAVATRERARACGSWHATQHGACCGLPSSAESARQRRTHTSHTKNHHAHESRAARDEDDALKRAGRSHSGQHSRVLVLQADVARCRRHGARCDDGRACRRWAAPDASAWCVPCACRASLASAPRRRSSWSSPR